MKSNDFHGVTMPSIVILNAVKNLVLESAMPDPSPAPPAPLLRNISLFLPAPLAYRPCDTQDDDEGAWWYHRNHGAAMRRFANRHYVDPWRCKARFANRSYGVMAVQGAVREPALRRSMAVQ
jgi:hypothetical protein